MGPKIFSQKRVACVQRKTSQKKHHSWCGKLNSIVDLHDYDDWQCFFFKATLSKLPSIYSRPWLNGHFGQNHWHQQWFFSSSTPQNHQKKLVNHNKHTCTKTLNNIEETTQKQAAHSNVTHFRFLDGFTGSASSSGIWSDFFAALLDFALALALAFAAATALARSPFGRREGFGGFSGCSALGKTDLTGNGG